jgi:hypothetical protein
MTIGENILKQKEKRKEIMAWLSTNHSRTILMASNHFGMTPSEVQKIVYTKK